MRHSNTLNPDVFDECVRPIVDAGKAQIITLPYQISASMTIEPAPGHTVGHAVLCVVSDDVTAYFTGDAFHHPAQLTRPELHLRGCDELATAIATRRSLVERILDEEAFLFPAHFPEPYHGRIALDDKVDEVYFIPGGAEQPTAVNADT